MSDYTLNEVLVHHDIAVGGISDDECHAVARAAGLLFACLTCATVGGISANSPESTRHGMARFYDFTCCDEETTVIF